MKKKAAISVITVFCILINISGNAIANTFSVPLWLDSFGTALSAYLLGPVCGAVVGMTSNIISGIFYSSVSVYAITSIAIGLIVGFMARKNFFDTFFGSMTVAITVTLVSVAISSVFNFTLNAGAVGNIWGNGIVDYLDEHGMNHYISSVIGQFYVDFLDKVITLALLYLVVRYSKQIKSVCKKIYGIFAKGIASVIRFIKDKFPKKSVTSVFMICLLMGSILSGVTVKADKSDMNFYSYVQTVYSGAQGLLGGEANDVVATSDGVLWAGTYNGLYRYNGSEFRDVQFDSVKNVNCLYVDEEGRLWIGTNDNGLTMAIGEEAVNVIDMNSGLPSNSVRTITKSSDGYYYIGTSDTMMIMSLYGGLKVEGTVDEIIYAHSSDADLSGRVACVSNSGNLYLLRDGKISDKVEKSGENEIYTCCRFDENGTLYVGSSSEKIYEYRVDDDKLTLSENNIYKAKDLQQINALRFTEDGYLFVCADNGVGVFSPDKKYNKIHLENFDNSIDAMAVDYQGNYWFASSRLGLMRMASASFTDLYGSYGMKKNVTNAVTKWQDRIYVGTDSGLDICDPIKGEQVTDKLTKLLKDTRIRCLYIDSHDNLWICSYGKGLLRVGVTGEIAEFDSKTGFCDWVRVVTELEDGTIVAAGDIGVSFIVGGGIVNTIPYGKDLSSAMVLCMLEGDDSLFLGTDGDGVLQLRDGKVIRRFSTTEGLSSGVILRIVKASDNSGYYLITSNGINFLYKDGIIKTLDDFPYSNNFDMWMGTDGKAFVLSSAGVFVLSEEDMLVEGREPEYELLDEKRGLNAGLTANSWDYMDDEGVIYLSCDSGVYTLDTRNYRDSVRSYRMKLSSVVLDGIVHNVERGENIVIDRDTKRVIFNPEVINYSLEDPYISYMMENVDSQEISVPASELTSVSYVNLPSGKHTFRMSLLDSNKNIIEESLYDIVIEKKIHDYWWFKVYMIVVGMLAVAWITWYIFSTRIRQTIFIQKQQLEFAKQQVQMGNETILAIARTVDAKDINTSQHSQRVSEYSVMIAKEMGFDDEECENLRKAALLHDIGKIGIPDSILNKPAKLTDEEYAVMKTHVTRGAEILKDFTVVDHVVDGALYHHERYDGKGYMSGLKGEEIPLYGRIIGVADAFDAMTQNRVYRERLDLDYVLGELKRCRGTQFDPQIADIMLRLVEECKVDLDHYEQKK